MPLPHHLLAEVTFSLAREGGRHMAVQSGFRSLFVFERESHAITHRFVTKPKEWVYPGTTVKSRISFDDPAPLVGRLGAGFLFELRDAHRRIGKGTVLALVGLKDLREAAREAAREASVRARMPSVRTPTGRPEAGEFADYAKEDIDAVVGDDAVDVLEAQLQTVLQLLTPVGEEAAEGLTYAPGKWTLKQVVGHLIDDERIFAYRILCVARGEESALPGFDENRYVEFANFEERSLSDLLSEYRIVREASLSLLRSLTPEAYLRRGLVNGYSASPRGLAFHVAGHELHHLRILRERYLRS